MEMSRHCLLPKDLQVFNEGLYSRLVETGITIAFVFRVVSLIVDKALCFRLSRNRSSLIQRSNVGSPYYLLEIILLFEIELSG